MTRRLATAVISLYPVAFRRRYGDELRALIDDTPPRAMILFDLLRGALGAHLRSPAGLSEVVGIDDRLRGSASGVLACWVIFAAAGFGFYKTTEDPAFATAGDANVLLGGAHVAVQALATLASIAVLAGALPLIVAAVKKALDDRSLRRLITAPVAAVGAFAGLTALLVWLAHTGQSHASSIDRAAFVAWGIAGLACAAVCVVAARKALFATPVSRRWLVVGLGCGTLVTAAMALMALAAALYAIVLPIDASGLAGSPNGPLGNVGTSLSLVCQLLVMAIAGGLAVTTVRRGWRAIGHPAAPKRRAG